MLDVGIIGLGPHWESKYRPILQKLTQRLRVRSVYSPVNNLADAAAADLNCSVSLGMLPLVQRDDVRAVLILDGGWCRHTSVEFACRQGKPAFLGGPLDLSPVALRGLADLTATQGAMLIPEFSHRYTPATGRLRELAAARLGRPLDILVEVPPSDLNGSATGHPAHASAALVAAFDWCRNLLGTAPAKITATAGNPGDCAPAGLGAGVVIEVLFRRPAAGGDAPRATIRLAPPGPADARPRNVQYSVQCAAGRATIDGPDRITWVHAGEEATETLTTERGDVEVLLDHFCRRVVGGLVPVPTLDDVSLALRLADLADQSLRQRAPINF